MERDKKGFIFDIITIIFFIICLVVLVFSNNLLLNITVAVIIILYTVLSNINIKKKKNHIFKEIQINKQTYMEYKEINKSTVLVSFMLTITSLLNIDVFYRNSNAFNKNPYTLHSILDFITSMSSQQASGSVINILVLILCILNLIKFKNSITVVSDDIIVFHDGNVIDISKIISLEYTHQYFDTKKYKILKIRTKDYLHKIMVDLNDSNKLTDYLNSKIIKTNTEE